jgi:hypothetical protein
MEIETPKHQQAIKEYAYRLKQQGFSCQDKNASNV